MKQLDKLLLRSFLPSFAVTFVIALFVFVMQTLWVYIDDIAGKGVSIFVLVELISYMSISMFPMALPTAMLISSVMTLGNLAERYELSSMKSAGVSLVRILMPLMGFSFLVAGFSFFCSNYLIPVSNLQFKSRLYDIRKQKPTLNMEEGLFNDDFAGYSIRIGKKDADDRTIRNVMIYDHTSNQRGQLTTIVADSGEMYVNSQNFFVMDLYNGVQYSEMEPNKPRDEGKRNFPFVRTSFDRWTKVFDLGEFDLNRTDTELFKSHHSMLSVRQLTQAIDSIDIRQNARLENMGKNIARNYRMFDFRDTTSYYYRRNNPDSDRAIKKDKPERRGREPMERDSTYRLAELSNFVQTFPRNKRAELANRGKTSASSLRSQIDSSRRAINRSGVSRVKHVFEKNIKYVFALSCVVFLFIGASMGAIVRKGGFGWPLLIAVVFFALFIVSAQLFKNLAERYVIDSLLASWLPILIFMPICLWLTIRAMNDRGISTTINAPILRRGAARAKAMFRKAQK